MENLIMTAVFVAFLIGAASTLAVLYPFPPFRTRRRALRTLGFSVLATFSAVIMLGFMVQRPDVQGPGVQASVSQGPVSQGAAGAAAPDARALAESVAAGRAAPAARPVAAIDAAPEAACEATPMDVVAVTGSHPVHTDPGADTPRLRNEKASKALGKPHFHQIDASTMVRRLCVRGDWTEVQITSPDWLTFVRGWVPRKALRGVETSDDGERVYVEEDFHWDADTRRHKPQIIAVVNRIARDHPGCGSGRIDPQSVARSTSRGSSADPVFFVTCGSGTAAFNVWFRPADAANGTRFVPVRPLARSEATLACEAAAKAAATHPSTVSFSRVMSLSYQTWYSGRARVASTFTARNAFNLELTYAISCLFEGTRMIDVSVAEAR